MPNRQEILDRFYWSNGPCCAGCDWWRSLNGSTGECLRSAPTSGDRLAVLGITGCSLPVGAGHVLTPRNHYCGEFRDEFDWSRLPPHYQRAVGAPCAPSRKGGE